MTKQQSLITAAVAGLTGKRTESAPGYCARWVRQVVDASGVLADRIPSGMDARQQFEWFKARGEVVDAKRGSVPGDILYKVTSEDGLHGHVGIRVPGNHVAENSSVHSHNGSDARGMRTVKAFGNVDAIVRLHDNAPDKTPGS